MTVPNLWLPIASTVLVTVPDDGTLRSSVERLSARLDQQQFDLYRLDNYYEGQQPLQFMAPEVRQQIGNRLAPLVINWPRTIVDSVQRRCYVEGFRLSGGGSADDGLLDIWESSDMGEWSPLGQVDALVHARSFLSVWADPEDSTMPRISVESAHQVVVEYEPGTKVVRLALKRFDDGDVTFGTLMERDRITRWARRDGEWTMTNALPNPLGAVPMIPLVNRPRVLNLDGESELTDVIPLADGVNKLATDMLVTSEHFVSPRRYATGIQVPTGPDRERLQAEAAAYWDDATKGKTWLAGQGVQFGQFPEATLAGFVDAIQLLTSQIAAIAGLPPHYLGIKGDNPASADAIRSAESTLVERAKEKHASWGGAYERAMRLAIAVRDGVAVRDLPAEYRGMETIWRDPQTPTVAQAADAAVKLTQGAVPLIDREQAQEDLGYSPLQIQRMKERAEEAASLAATADVRARYALARELQADGLTENAALAAAGLLQAAALNTPQ